MKPGQHSWGMDETNVGNDGGTCVVDFAEYVSAKRPAWLRTAHQLSADRFAAEDLLQEGLLKTYQAWHRIDDKNVAGAYLRRTMTNHQISSWRKRRIDEYPTDLLPDSPTSDESFDQVELRLVMRKALMRLPERDRELLALRYYGSYTDSEIADELGMSVGTVKSAMWRALRKLREDVTVCNAHARISNTVELLSA